MKGPIHSSMKDPIHSMKGPLQSYDISSYNSVLMVTAASFAILLVAAHHLREESNIQASSTTVEKS